MTTSLYPTGHSAVRLCNVTGDALHYDAFVTGSYCTLIIMYTAIVQQCTASDVMCSNCLLSMCFMLLICLTNIIEFDLSII